MRVHRQVILGCILISFANSMLLPGVVVRAAETGDTAVTIDGSLHPELISDDQAIHMWLLAASGIADSSPEHVQRTLVIVDAVGLNPADTAALLADVNNFGNARRALTREAWSATDATSISGKQQLLQISAKSAQLFADTKSQIYAHLSAQGRQQFAQHLIHVKQRMRIGPGRSMSQN